MLGLCLTIGCGGADVKPLDMGGPDGDKISALIEEVNEGIGSAKEVESLFVKGTKPDTRKMGKFGYTVVGKPTVSGTTATAKVRVDPASGGATVGEVEWTFEKEGEKWKIKSAPLP
jgi:hypothetical protein